MRIASLYFILLSQICFENAFAQSASSSASPSGQHYFFTNYTVDDGLSNNEVGCIVKDSEGYVWAGTQAGLNRFNGYDFTVYKSIAEDSTTLPSNVINTLLADRGGDLWTGTGQGICRYDKKKNCFKRFYLCSNTGARISSFECHDLLEDSKRTIWAGTGAGLLKYNAERDCFEQALEGLPVSEKNSVTSVTEDDDGTLWMVNYDHLLHYNKDSRAFKEFDNKISDGKFQALKVYRDLTNKDFLWIATWGSGIVHFNKLTGEYAAYKFQPDGLPNLDNIVLDVFHKDKNKLWLATNRGVIAFDEAQKTFEGFITDPINQKTVINGQANYIYRDDEGVIWMGSVGGLCNIHPEKQTFISHPLWITEAINEYYYDEAADKMYAVRIYSNRALVIYDRKQNQATEYKIPDADALRAEPFAVIKDTNGLIWIGTTKGIYTFDEKEKKFSLFDIEKQLHIPDRSVFIRQIVKDSDGNLWFTCFSKGLLRVDPQTKKATAYFHDNKDGKSFPLYAITGITVGTGKTIYMCDDRAGVAEFNYETNATIHYNAKEKKYAALFDATDVAVDRSNRIWVTTRNNGLVCIDKNKNGEAVTYVKDDFGNIIDEQSYLAVDTSGKVWVIASNGIYRFDPSLKSFTQFTVHDGLPVRTLTHPLYPLNNGTFAFHFYKGIFCFDPMKVSKTTKPLNTHITSILINGKAPEYNSTIDRLDTIYLDHTENNLTVDFAATDFAYPSSTLYSYMLEGIDNHWSVPARTRVVNFSQLPPGQFRFHIRAGSGSPEKKIFIRIVPAWWQTALFKWALLIAIALISFFIIRFFISFRYRQQIAKLEQQREIEQVRMRISRDIHDEIGSGLTKIKLMSRNLAKAKEESVMQETSAKISSASDELIQNLGEIVWTVNPANDTLENIFAFVRNYVSKLFEENADIKLTLDFTEPERIPKEVIINPDIKRNLLLILKESLTNIFKHSQATEVLVSMRVDKSKIELQIQDNGKGIATGSHNGFGNGINNMRKRSESVNGLFTFESNDNGTVIRLRIPMTTERKIPT
jgi:ligand-binding sensor domain-containing protein/signal transduction histidine kinase